MIVYDQTRLGGFGVLFHTTGSALIKLRTLIPSLLSASLSVICAHEETLNSWLNERILFVSGFFTCLSFLLAMVLTTRMGKSTERFREGSNHLVKLQAKLLEAAVMTNAWLSPGCLDEQENNFLKHTLNRWLRGFHVLALFEIQGIESRLYGTLVEEEIEALSTKERKASRLMNWIIFVTNKNRKRFDTGDPQFAHLLKLLTEAHETYVRSLALAETPFPFPLSQVSVFGISMFAMLSPFVWGVQFPNSTVFVFFVSFTVIAILFSINSAAASLEAPYDDDANSVPIAYYSIRFHDDAIAVLYKDPPNLNLGSGKSTQNYVQSREGQLRSQVRRDQTAFLKKKRMIRSQRMSDYSFRGKRAVSSPETPRPYRFKPSIAFTKLSERNISAPQNKAGESNTTSPSAPSTTTTRTEVPNRAKPESTERVVKINDREPIVERKVKKPTEVKGSGTISDPANVVNRDSFRPKTSTPLLGSSTASVQDTVQVPVQDTVQETVQETVLSHLTEGSMPELTLETHESDQTSLLSNSKVEEELIKENEITNLLGMNENGAITRSVSAPTTSSLASAAPLKSTIHLFPTTGEFSFPPVVPPPPSLALRTTSLGVEERAAMRAPQEVEEEIRAVRKGVLLAQNECDNDEEIEEEEKAAAKLRARGMFALLK